MLTDQDKAFLLAFEQHTLKPEAFTHLAHLRLAWLYLRLYSLDEAIKRTTEGIENYAASIGAIHKFHYTLTAAVVKIMAARRCDSGHEEGFSDYLASNSDLCSDLKAVVGEFYSDGRLADPRAKSDFLLPDIKPLPQLQS